MDRIVIYDVDGTLVNVSGIRHLVAAGLKNRDFDAFHRASVDCPPIPEVVYSAQLWGEAGLKVGQLTARQEKYRSLTSFWIADHKVPSDLLVMRDDGDFRSDAEIKREKIARLLEQYEIELAYDDNPAIWEVWDEFSIPCVRVPGFSEE